LKGGARVYPYEHHPPYDCRTCSDLQPTFPPKTPFDPSVLLRDAGDMAAEMAIELRRPWDESKAQAVVDHGVPAGGQREALAIGARDELPSAAGVYGSPVSADSLATAPSKSWRYASVPAASLVGGSPSLRMRGSNSTS
jgi:hypothetical protein